MIINRLRLGFSTSALATFALASIALASPPSIELIPVSQLTHVARLWQHGGDVPFGTPTSASPPKPLIVKADELPKPYAIGDSIYWDEYKNDGKRTIKPGDLFVFVYKGELTVRPVGAVTAAYVQTVLGTKVALADVKGTVRRVIRVVDDLTPASP